LMWVLLVVPREGKKKEGQRFGRCTPLQSSEKACQARRLREQVKAVSQAQKDAANSLAGTASNKYFERPCRASNPLPQLTRITLVFSFDLLLLSTFKKKTPSKPAARKAYTQAILPLNPDTRFLACRMVPEMTAYYRALPTHPSRRDRLPGRKMGPKSSDLTRQKF